MENILRRALLDPLLKAYPLEIDLDKRPVKIDLIQPAGNTVLKHKLMMVLIALLVGGMLMTLLSGQYLLAVILFVFVALLGVMTAINWYDHTRYWVATLGADDIETEDRRWRDKRQWKEDYSNFSGIRIRQQSLPIHMNVKTGKIEPRYRDDLETLSPKTMDVIELVHEDNMRTMPLYLGPVNKENNQRAQQYADILKQKLLEDS